MRKRYSRSYTVLSFLTMFSYREQPLEVPFLFSSYSSSLRLSAMVLANSDALLGGV